MKPLAKQTIELLTLIGGCNNIKEVKEIMESQGEKVEKLAYDELSNNSKCVVCKTEPAVAKGRCTTCHYDCP